ncbi:LapA family protein [Bacillus kexueae]|uniref:LapA family protein n=1 Tax=Aeribacillus kexueae TaxID=2078952 RepID=UPI001FAFB649|nr:lipopolysaccharide assembly protein LapA domain-containing protein [Bacillus kexueae]
MKNQTALLLSLIFALIVSIFAVINVEPVEIDYLFGTANWPLVIVIIGSAIMGAITVMLLGAVRMLSLQRKIKKLERENALLKQEKEQNEEQEKNTEPPSMPETK